MKTLTEIFEELFTEAAKLGSDARISAFVTDAIDVIEKRDKYILGATKVYEDIYKAGDREKYDILVFDRIERQKRAEETL